MVGWEKNWRGKNGKGEIKCHFKCQAVVLRCAIVYNF
jgi:hypothetical protein